VSIEVFTTAIPELIEGVSVPEIVETLADSQIYEATPAGVDVVVDTETLTQTVVIEVPGVTVDRWVEATIVESAVQGPPGPPGASGASYPAKHLTYTDGEVSEVRLFSDAAATQLAERRVIARSGGNVTGITYFDGAGALLHTRTFTYSPDGALSGIVDE